MSPTRPPTESAQEDDLVAIHVTESPVEAEALAARLTSAGFRVVVRNLHLAARIYLGDFGPLLQQALLVPRSRAAEARAAVEQLLTDQS